MTAFVRWTPVFAVLLTLPACAAELTKDTAAAFDRYIAGVEARLKTQLASTGTFLWTDQSASRRARVRDGEVVVEPSGNTETVDVPGGLIHDWTGAVFIPDTTLAKTIALAQDYNRHKDYYKPEVIDSKILRHEGNDFQISLRLLKKKILTVVLDTRHDVHYVPVDATHWYSRSYSTYIAEVENPGKPNEYELPAGNDHGFLWRLYSYWRFVERDGGVYVECEAVSLTRGVPSGLGWLINPIIRDLPRESLANTLLKTQAALRR